MASPRTPPANSWPDPGTAPGPLPPGLTLRSTGPSLRRARRTHIREWIGCGPIPCEYRRAAGRATEGLPRAPRRDATGAHSGRRPTHNGSRRSTRGEVHDYDAGTFEPRTACPRDATGFDTDRRPGHRAYAGADAVDDESPHSIFWVSQVYP